jgi:hypothetical protein
MKLIKYDPQYNYNIFHWSTLTRYLPNVRFIRFDSTTSIVYIQVLPGLL